jgi:hypothetical protein
MLPKEKKLRLRMEPSKIVMRFADERVLWGYTEDFSRQPDFPFLQEAPEILECPIEVLVEGLKGIFFVRDFQGNPKSREPKKNTRGDEINRP